MEETGTSRILLILGPSNPSYPRVDALNETILIVDDELLVLKVISAVLDDEDYKLLKAASPDEGLRICIEQKRANLPIDLAIVDVVMPGMSGPELMECLAHHGIIPGGLLYISGYPREFITERHGVDPNARLLQKPFTAPQLISVVRDMLSGRRQAGHKETR